MLATQTRTAAFLDLLAADPVAEYHYDRHPVEVMTEFGLTDEEQAVLLHGTIDEVRQATGPGTEAFKIKIRTGQPD